MKLRQFAVLAALLVAASASGSGTHPSGPDIPARPIGPGQVVGLHGLSGAEFGDSETELTRRGMLRTAADTCGTTLAGHGTASPIFVDDRLVLLWLDDPMSTPEGITVGTPVGEVLSRYPSAVRLHAPPRTYRFDGLLARDGERGYLFLHDGTAVREIIAGYADWARRLFDEGYGPC
ncbi:hypothetical protein AWV63_16800 [Micromonospora rifamycinica]|uniref:Uncharacterized protein n=1 Tax=Micromonospora rifamycinica TaxID=291594 RepID=A0A109IJC4_9ACTN|nr:hypothetical protein [Micromonospora rifamycinica]KWV31593.1 hypothetical protein AWV63_16800 [Micromonospora rifamycinica]SCG75899.1 hypothetical protein GA0070623_4056 [Micromonospora rifamycinica]